jgi:hypothetical protein
MSSAPHKTTDVKPCPFCGGKAVVSAWGSDGFVVGCEHDGAADPEACGIAPRSIPFISQEAAIKAWNTRAT